MDDFNSGKAPNNWNQPIVRSTLLLDTGWIGFNKSLTITGIHAPRLSEEQEATEE